jgi:hypothetical protein
MYSQAFFGCFAVGSDTSSAFDSRLGDGETDERLRLLLVDGVDGGGVADGCD